MKVILFGATGMVGKGVLLECLDHEKVTEVLAVGRSELNIEDPKLKQVKHENLMDLDPIKDDLNNYDACFFCIGVSAAGMNETSYSRITYDYTLNVGKTLFELNPEMTFTYVSGQGTDSSENGRIMWARVKGKTENDLMKIGFSKAIMFRPGIIIPKRGIKSKTRLYQFFYDYFMWFLKIIKVIWPDSVTDTTRMGKAMINAHLYGKDQSILNPKDINELAGK